MPQTVPATWTNWGGTASCRPARVLEPSSEDEIVAAVAGAAERGERVRVTGAGHSFTDICCTDGTMLSLRRHRRVLDVSGDLVTVDAGITLADLNEALASNGLALPNLGDIVYQSVAGAVSTGTHGTGVRLGNIATRIAALRLVLADGSTLDCAPSIDPDVFRAAQVSLGALGVISQVTLRCVPAFRLRAIEGPKRLEQCLEEMSELADEHDHHEFFWFPHTDWCLAKTNDRTDEPATPPGRVREFVEQIAVDNWALGAVCRIGALRPRWIPALNRVVARLLSKRDYVDRSDRVFASPRLVRFAEMEYSVPREAGPEAVRGVREVIERSALRVNFPVEVRYAAGDDILLSPSHGRDSCYVAVHVYRGMQYEPYFREVEAVMRSLGGRPHWGKLHFRTAGDLAPAYPAWDLFASVRDKLDADRRFANAYTERVLGA